MRERKLSAREVIARSYPTWDHDIANRLIAWLNECGYEIVEKQYADATLVPSASDTTSLSFPEAAVSRHGRQETGSPRRPWRLEAEAVN